MESLAIQIVDVCSMGKSSRKTKGVKPPTVSKAPTPTVGKAPTPTVSKAPTPTVSKAPTPTVSKAPTLSTPPSGDALATKKRRKKRRRKPGCFYHSLRFVFFAQADVEASSRELCFGTRFVPSELCRFG